MKRFSNRILLISSMTALMSTGGAVYAQDNDGTLEEVIVTATKRASTIQDVPFSINAQTQKDIERSGVTNLEELSRNVAGLTVQNLGPGQSQVAIRGVSAGQIVRDQPGVPCAAHRARCLVQVRSVVRFDTSPTSPTWKPARVLLRATSTRLPMAISAAASRG